MNHADMPQDLASLPAEVSSALMAAVQAIAHGPLKQQVEPGTRKIALRLC